MLETYDRLKMDECQKGNVIYFYLDPLNVSRWLVMNVMIYKITVLHVSCYCVNFGVPSGGKYLCRYMMGYSTPVPNVL